MGNGSFLSKVTKALIAALFLLVMFPLAACSLPAPQSTTLENPYPLAELGPYPVGQRSVTFVDDNRDQRVITMTIWYPAVLHADTASSPPIQDAAPDLSSAPYPLLLTGRKYTAEVLFAPHLVSYGFVVVAIEPMYGPNIWGTELVDAPLDLLSALNSIEDHPPEELEGVVDTNRVGVLGYSFDGYTALALSGARADPQFYLAQCAGAAGMQPKPPDWWINYICTMSQNWDAFSAYAGEEITTSEDGLWQPITDGRILAVMPMAPEGAWLFGKRGLESVDRPCLVIGATADNINFYDLEAVYIFEHLGTPDKTMISLVGMGHMKSPETGQLKRIRHFAVAFFAYHLQGRADNAQYFSQVFVEQHSDLAWGVYTEK